MNEYFYRLNQTPVSKNDNPYTPGYDFRFVHTNTILDNGHRQKSARYITQEVIEVPDIIAEQPVVEQPVATNLTLVPEEQNHDRHAA